MDADQRTVKDEVTVATAAKNVFDGLEDRRLNGDAMTPGFLELEVAASKQRAEVEVATATSGDDRRKAVQRHVKYLQDSINHLEHILDGAPGPAIALMKYHLAVARLWADEMGVSLPGWQDFWELNDPKPPTQPAPSVTASARDEIQFFCEHLETLRANGEPMTPEFVEMLCLSHRRLAEASAAMAKTKADRIAIGENYLKHITPIDVFGIVETNTNLDKLALQRVQVDYYHASAAAWVEKLKNPPRKPDTNALLDQRPALKNEAACAKRVFDLLALREMKASEIQLVFYLLDAECRYSRRWAAAEAMSAGNPKDRLAAIEAHLHRMTALRDAYLARGDEFGIIPQYQMQYYAAEAELWIERAGRQP